ncbi:MAG: M48 family metalloprotease [Phycisphaerae bacterium]|nr:M48 family metalloprotease [Phycisphaerae bacterium]MDP7287105.1 M48 family metalloprotease [Phycisphaerae bacterium]
MKRKLTYILTACFLALGSSVGCSKNPATGKLELMMVSRTQEIAIGDSQAAKFEANFGGRHPNAKLQAYVHEIGMRLAKASDRDMPYDFAVLRSKTPNAFALPGGRVYITVGLFKSLGSEEELAAVLAHEITHICARHSVKGLQRELGGDIAVQGVQFVPFGGYVGLAVGLGASLGKTLTGTAFSRSDEYQADEIGIRYMKRAGFNPRGMPAMLTSLGAIPEAATVKIFEVLSTHPQAHKRIVHAKEVLQENYPDSPPLPDPAPGWSAGLLGS